MTYTKDERTKVLDDFLKVTSHQALHIVAKKHAVVFTAMDDSSLAAALTVIKNGMKEQLQPALKDLHDCLGISPLLNDMAMKAFVAELALAAHRALLKEGIVKS